MESWGPGGERPRGEGRPVPPRQEFAERDVACAPAACALSCATLTLLAAATIVAQGRTALLGAAALTGLAALLLVERGRRRALDALALLRRRSEREREQAMQGLRASQRRLQGQLVAAERMASVGTLAAGVAHEINNPLGCVAMHVAMLQRGVQRLEPGMPPGEVAAMRRSLARVQEGSERVRRLVVDLMHFAAGGEDEAGLADVREVLERTLQLAEPELRHHVRVHTHFEPTPPARASAHRLGQVFLNLVLNAHHALVEAGQEGAELRVGLCMPPGADLEVVIEDNGPGMSAEVAARAFEPFFTTRTQGRGTGLGLFVCRTLVTQLGGHIELQTAPGQGARFTLRLPAETARQSHVAPRCGGRHGSGARRRALEPEPPAADEAEDQSA